VSQVNSQAAKLVAEHAIKLAPKKPLEQKANKDNKVKAEKEAAFNFMDYAKQLEDIYLASTSVAITPEQASAPADRYGVYKREEPDVVKLKDELMEKFPQTRNVNYLVAVFAKAMVGAKRLLLLAKGVTPEQIKACQRESLQRADKQTTGVVSEMLGNIFLMKLSGTSKKGRKKVKVAEKALGKALKQLALYRGRNLPAVELLEMELAAQAEILAKFEEEKGHLAYQLELEVKNTEVEKKLTRLEGYISKAKRLMESNQKKLDQLIEKEQKKMFRVKTGIIRGKIYG